jgi:glycosyltransferase involved in cell wall biosynthesis
MSVVINNYNYGAFIGEAIKSVLDQKYTNIELIVVDDGSTDNSRNNTMTKVIVAPNSIKGVSTLRGMSKPLRTFVQKILPLFSENHIYVMHADARQARHGTLSAGRPMVRKMNDAAILPDFTQAGHLFDGVLRRSVCFHESGSHDAFGGGLG